MPSKAAYLRYQRQRTPPNLAKKISAAKRVLAQPKLLENILLHLCKCYNVRGIPLKTPVTKLFVLQRVNSTFQNTIQGSIALARRMWLYPPEKRSHQEICASKDLQDLYMGPLEWLFDMLGNAIRTRDPDEPEDARRAFEGEVEIWHQVTYPVDAGEGLKGCRKRGFRGPGASWRDMAAFNTVPEEKMHIVFSVIEYVEVGLGKDPSAQDQRYGYEMPFDGEDFDVDANDTLGAVFDKWAEGTSESTERQVDTIKMLVSNEVGVHL